MKKKESKPIVYFMAGALIAMIVTVCIMGFFQDRNLQVARLQSKMDCWDAEEMCVQLHDRVLDVEGYCDITPEGQELGGYIHYFDCSWAKLKLQSQNEHLTRRDRFDLWYLDCEHKKTVKVILDG